MEFQIERRRFNPLFPASGPATRSFNGLHPKSKFLAVSQIPSSKRQLQGTKFTKLKLTPEQATKINAFARTAPEKAEALLTKIIGDRFKLSETQIIGDRFNRFFLA